MNPAKLSEAQFLFARLQEACQASPQAFVVACPPFAYLPQALSQKSDSLHCPHVGAQDVSGQDGGAVTGEISAKMLQDLGVRYAIIGHSETRQNQSLTNQAVNQKVKQALANGLNPVLCIGFAADPKQEGINYDELAEQVWAGVQGVELNSQQTIYLAYEPVWAIGTGQTASNELIAEVNEFLLAQLSKLNLETRVEILYGGSVDDQSLPTLSQIETVSGFLIGGTSLKPEKFTAMIQSQG